ncbi:hypothetical protein RB620_22845 [Paenibacillus sp. LHD-117]|uniref:hypothetical protein n=1 Tax=Paenibacillus sp. LHD-117 TaxID=3071412 RepID=UPI0027DEC062|nr:hypothetical protein [Paenibacillus sp. LHD-117]MDQ6422270.1 hypothetical protein [Paenibacillus sp. LHD-117]
MDILLLGDENVHLKKFAILFLMLAGLCFSVHLAEASKELVVEAENVTSMQVVGGLAGTKPSPL